MAQVTKEQRAIRGEAAIKPDGRDTARVTVIVGTLLFAVGKAGGGPDMGEEEKVCWDVASRGGNRDGGGERGKATVRANGHRGGNRVGRRRRAGRMVDV